MNQPDLSDLQWRSLLYFRNELSASDRASFEAELADNQEAREALASAVQFCEVAKAAFESDAITTRLKSKRSAWVAASLTVVVAASLLILATVQIGGYPSLNSVAVNVDEPVDEDLLAAWAENSSMWPMETASPDSASVLSDRENRNDDFDDLADTPSWMLIAVQSQETEDLKEAEETSSDTQ